MKLARVEPIVAHIWVIVGGTIFFGLEFNQDLFFLSSISMLVVCVCVQD